MPIHLSGICAVVFDLDDTLYPEQSYAFSGFAAVGDWLRSRIQCPFDPAHRMRELFLSGDRRHIFDRLLTELGCPESRPLVVEMIQHYRTHQPQIALYEDARAALERGQCVFRLGLISDGPLAMQKKKVEALGIRKFFDEITLTDQWGSEFWKPHIRAFEMMQVRLKTCGPALVYVADNCAKDFVAPRLLGWRTVWLRRPGAIYHDVPAPAGGEPEFTTASLAELDLSS